MPQYQGIWTLAQAAQLQSTQRWATDPLFENTTLLLQADNAANGAQNNTFLDSSSNNFTITRNGNTTQGSFTPFSQSPGWWSNYFGGDGNYLSTAYSADFSFSTGEFSIECWSYVQDAGRTADANKYGALISQGVVASTTNQWQFLIRIVSGVITEVLLEVNGAAAFSVTGQSISINAWHHFALCRSGTTLSIFVDGTRIGTTTYSTAINANTSGTLQIARNAYANTYQNWLSGYISNVRILNGTSAYSASSSTLTVPALPITDVTNTKLLTCQSNRFIDTNTQVAAKTITVNGTPSVQAFSPFAPQYQYTPTVTGGSGYFDGSSSLSLSQSTALSLGTGDFTVEAWVYPTANPASFWSIIDARGSATNIPWAAGLRLVSGNLKGTFYNGADIQGSITVPLNAWTHIVFSRVGSTLRSFINGTVDINTNMTTNLTAAGTQYIGGIVDPAYSTGYMASMRIVKGSGVTSATVPTAPLTAITNTQLLLNFTNAGITDGTLKNVLQTVGNAQVSTSVVKYGTGSMAFDGSGDYLVSNPATTDLYAFGSGNFTIEMWIYFNAVASIQCVYDSRPLSTQGAYPLIYLNSDATIRYFVSSADRITSSTVLSGVWYHLAITRLNGTTRMYLNGTQAGSNYTDATVYLNSAGRPWIGINAFNGTQGLNGYIDDLRITKGIARYTQNFTPPSVALPRQ